MTEFVRTPEELFADLPDFPFEPHWHEWDGLRLHYLDEGEGRPVVLFHGEPTWCFLYRKVIPPLSDAGYRVIAPDYPGFGKSDKPTDPGFYSYDRHVAAMTDLLGALDIAEATAVGQDWGGPIGFRVAVENSEWFNRISVLNTGVFTGRARMNEDWMRFRDFVARNEDVPVGYIMERSQASEWGGDVIAGYAAPFPTPEHKVGVRRFPEIVPLSEEDEAAPAMSVLAERLAAWEHPAQVLFSTEDPIFSTEAGRRLAELIPGASELETVEGAGHFLQEDRGEEVGSRIAAFLRSTD